MNTPPPKSAAPLVAPLPVSPLMRALGQFEAVEANLGKLERLWEGMEKLIPGGVVFTEIPEYEDYLRSFQHIQAAMPKIDGWALEVELCDLNEIARMRMDARESGEFECEVSVETYISAPGKALREYRFKFTQKRRELVRDALAALIDAVDANIRVIRKGLPEGTVGHEKVIDPQWKSLQAHFDQIGTLLGSDAKRLPRWYDMSRHLGFGLIGDFNDIERADWPAIKAELRKGVYAVNEPIPTQVGDLADLVASKPKGPVITALNWEKLQAEDFERLVFSLIGNEPGYENPEWLMKTNAPDKGRDLSVTRVTTDQLTGTMRHRVIIQCKHWQQASISVPDLATLEAQMKLWEPPRVDVCIIATSGRFTADAVTWVEKHNQSNSSLRIEMWPESHLERLLAARPSFIAEFGLR